MLGKRRWDSSDPDRAPPPLPMNPSSGSPKTRSNAAPSIQAAAASLTEKMRENAPSPYTTNPMPLKSSPEKSLIKGQYHKRMQSLQDTRSEFRNYLESRSTERPSRASLFETGDKSRDKSPTRSGNSTTRDSERESPQYHVSSRYLSKPILGENTPPSATMLALQNMQVPGENEQKSSSVSNPPVPPPSNNPTLDALSAQILSLTSIATNLQKEMAQLSRRSKDNATDLLSLKAATNARDEDIRRSIRELASNISSKFVDIEAMGARSAPCGSASPGYMVDSKAYDSSPSSRKSYAIPRVASPGGYALERDLCVSPAPISDGSASIALLEKVLREMATKEAQDKLLELVDEVKRRPAKDGADKDADKNVTKMLEEILNLVKENPPNRALVRSGTSGDSEKAQGIDSQSRSIPPAHDSQTADDNAIQKRVVTEDVVELLKRVKNSVAEGGGLTNEVKALVRELRGEVLGMGREIARKLDEASASWAGEEETRRAPGKEEIAAIVQTGLTELKQQMAYMIQEHQRELSTAVSRGVADSTEIYTAVKTAMAEFSPPQQLPPASSSVGMEKEDILEAVREAWETYKPEIELQNFGLEREEILECLSEGLKAYQPKHEAGITYDQVLAAVKAGLQNFVPPPIQPQPTITRDEIIAAVKECLESFELSIPEPSVTKEEIFAVVSEALAGQNALTRADADPGITRDDVLNAVTEGLAAHRAAAKEMGEANVTKEDVIVAVSEALATQQSTTREPESNLTREDVLNAISEGLASQTEMLREIELNKDDLMEAITSGFHEATNSTKFNVGEQVLQRLDELVQGIKDDFKQYSAASGRDTEQVLDALKDGLEGLRSEVESYVDRAADVTGKDEIIDTVKEGFRLLQADMERAINEAAGSAGRGNPDTPELLDAMEKEFEHLRQTLSSLLIRSSVSSDKDEILDAIRDLSESQRPGTDTSEVVKTVKEEFENLRETIGMSLVKSGPSEKDEILDAIHDLSENQRPGTDTSEVVKTVREEFENLRETIGMSLVKSGPSEKDEIIAALRESFEILQAETMQRREESMLSSTTELLDAFNDGVDVIRGDLEKVLNKPADDSSAEILETLREGLASIKVEMEALRESQKEFEETTTTRGKELILASENAIGNDIERLRVLISQLQIKVEAIEANSQASQPPADTLRKEHLDEVLTAVRDVHGSVVEVGAREMPLDPAAARKDDIDVIETLLRSTKAKIDEMDFPGQDEIAKSEHIMALEALISETKDTINELATRMEAEGPTKSEIGTLETLLKDVWVAVDDLKNNEKSAQEDPERVVKSDLQTVEAMIFEVKTQIEELKLPDVETLPTKAEIQELGGLVTEFKEKFESEAELTAQAFEARKVEHGGLAEKIDEAKAVVGELRDELKSKLDGSQEGLSELKNLIEGLTASAGTFSTVESIKELSELINREFERARGEQEAAKLETEERDAAALVKQDETRAGIVCDLSAKIDERIGEILAKYDELQAAVDSKFTEVETRDAAAVEHLTTTKSIAEDIKLVIGAMGDSVTETCERMSVDAKTFFEKVGESYNKMEAMHNELKEQQEQSKAELGKAAAVADRLERQILEDHPQILSAIKDILFIVGQHYEHSQRTTEQLKTDLCAIPAAIPSLLPALPPPEPEKYDDTEVHKKLDIILGHAEKEIPVPEKYDDSEVHKKLDTILENTEKEIPVPEKYDDTELHKKLDTILENTEKEIPVPEKYDDTEVRKKLDTILENTEREIPVPEKYDDTELHKKLDIILGHAENTSKSMAHVEKLEEIHEKVMATSREITEMVATQSRLLVEDYDRKKREAEEAAIALEKRIAQKEKVEAEIVNLQEEKESLLNMILALKQEKEELTKQNMKLNKELSSLETALEIRHEEMQLMEERAETLERRILEGVLDHARSVLLSRPGNHAQHMNLKRVPSNASTATKASRISTTSMAKDGRNLVSSGVGMALKRRNAAKMGPNGPIVSSNSGKERRILSLSHVTGNKGSADRPLTMVPAANGGLTSLKRSHSVKSNLTSRKASWGGNDAVANKENEIVQEMDEHDSGAESDTGTQRRTSYAGTCPDSLYDPRDRKPSYASSVNGAVAEHSGSILEGNSEDKENREAGDGEDYQETGGDQTSAGLDEVPQEGLSDLEPPPKVIDMIPAPSDSGIGSEIN